MSSVRCLFRGPGGPWVKGPGMVLPLLFDRQQDGLDCAPRANTVCAAVHPMAGTGLGTLPNLHFPVSFANIFSSTKRKRLKNSEAINERGM